MAKLFEKFIRDNKWETVVYPHKYQQRSILTPAMFTVLLGGKLSGKTSWGPFWLIKKFDEHPGEDGMIVAPTYDMLKQIALVSFENAIEHTAYQGVGSQNGVKLGLHQHDNYYLTPFNKVFLGTAQEPKHLEGKHVCAIWADEIGQYNYDAGKVLKSRIDKGGGQLLGSTTPYNEGWLYLDWYKKYLDGFVNPVTHKPVYDFIQFSSLANPNYPVELWEQNKAEMSTEEFQMFYEGKFTHLMGLVYPMPVMEHLSYDKTEERFGFIDWGYTDKMAFGVMGHNRPKHLWKLYKTFAESKLDLIEFAERIILLIRESGVRRIFYDWHEQTDPFTLQRILLEKYNLTIDFIPAPVQKIAEGVRVVRTLIKNQQLLVDENNTIDAQDEFNTYKMKKDGTPEEKEHNDVMDGMRYGITGEIEFEKGFEEVIEVHRKGFLTRRIEELERLPEEDYWEYD